ncbi:MAG: hypothetical protein WDK96_02450 [Candidatus Paceibacterota bacterium]
MILPSFVIAVMFCLFQEGRYVFHISYMHMSSQTTEIVMGGILAFVFVCSSISLRYGLIASVLISQTFPVLSLFFYGYMSGYSFDLWFMFGGAALAGYIFRLIFFINWSKKMIKEIPIEQKPANQASN